MTAESPNNNKDHSIAGQSAEHFVAMDDSLASLLTHHGIKIRDFILLSFLSDQGPMSVLRLSRVVGIEPGNTLNSLRRLSAVSLVIRNSGLTDGKYESVARLTTRGEDIAQKISSAID